jgi:thiol-activated cytolysin/VCBS repeat protein
MRVSSYNRCLSVAAVAALLMLTPACAKDGGTDPGPEPPADVNGYVATLGTWEEFSPPLPTSNEATGAEQTIEQVVDAVTYVCSETPYSVTDTPTDLVMYEPNASIMWVGNLIQGASYRGGTGSFQELSIRQRNTLKLSIDLLTGDNFAEVNDPSLTSVQSAIGGLIQRATDAGHRSGSSIDFASELAHSTEQAALALGLSGHYLGGAAKAELSVQRNAAQRTLVAHFVQKMFTIAIELPQTPGAFFSSALTADLLQQQVAAGNIGRNNLPVYLASVTYGRTLTYSLTSTDSEDRMRAAIQASYNGVVGGGSGYTEVELRETLSQQNLKVTAIGGEGQNVLDLISQGNLKAYFTTDAPLTSAKPISYQLNFLGNNSIAKVSETTAYQLRVCNAKASSPGRFDFLNVQQAAAGILTPYRAFKGDLNADGRDDLIWNHLVSGSNQTVVALANANGTFTFQAAVTHPATPAEGWSNGFELYTGDFDGDGDDDLVWNRRQATQPNRLYVARSNGDGTFSFLDPQTLGAGGWATGWKTFVGDVDNDGDDDLVFNFLSTQNVTWIAGANGDGTFTLGASAITHSAMGWGAYHASVTDVNGDLRADIVWNNVPGTASVNRTWVARSKGDGTYELLGYQDHPAGGGGWPGYTGHLGDINGDGRVDQIWPRTPGSPIPIHRGLAQASGLFSFPSYQSVVRPMGAGTLATSIGDFNGDGRADILWNELSASRNHVWIGLGNVEGRFDFTPVDQEHPATNGASEDWTVFAGGVLILDVNGDGRDDVVWNDRAVTNRIYVALARTPGS